MPDKPEPAATVSAEEFRALLRIAGLDISGDRAPFLLDELNAQLAHARELDGVLDEAKEPDFAPYDPTFPKIAPEEGGE